MCKNTRDEKFKLQRALDIKDQEECLDVYQDWAGTYDQTMIADLKYIAPDLVAKLLISHLSEPESCIADFGCGTGLVGKTLHDNGFTNVEGLDFSGAMLAEAKTTGVYRQLIECDLTKTVAVEDGHYDAGLCAGLFTLGHLDSSCLDEVLRTIRSGGLFAAAIRLQAWEEMGFAAHFAKMEENNEISTIEKVQMSNYENSDKKDGVYLLVKKS